MSHSRRKKIYEVRHAAPEELTEPDLSSVLPPDEVHRKLLDPRRCVFTGGEQDRKDVVEMYNAMAKNQENYLRSPSGV